MQDVLAQMCRRVLRHARGVRTETALPGVSVGFIRTRHVPANVTCRPGICLVLQGAKRMTVGRRLYRYAAGSCFASLVELPATACTTEASANKPYVATAFHVDQTLLASLLAETVARPVTTVVPGFGVAKASSTLIEAWDRYLALLDAPHDLPALAPARARELTYRLLQSDYGPMLRQIAREDGRLSQVRRAISWLRSHYTEHVSTEALARIAGMSIPTFHRHFRAATALSPLQYQKWLRLQAARRLLMTDADAGRTAYAVGYESASQFSREYARLFGLPPKQDASRLREPLVEGPDWP